MNGRTGSSTGRTARTNGARTTGSRPNGGRTGSASGSTAKKPGTSGTTNKKPGTSTAKKPGSAGKKPGTGTTKNPGSGAKKPTNTAKKPNTGNKKPPKTAKKPRKPVNPKVKNALLKRGLVKSFRNFKYRWWSNRWKSWLFYNSLDGCWYSYAPGCDCFVPADCLAYDPPDECDGPGDDDTGCPSQAMQCPVLTPDDGVDEPDEPQADPPPLKGENDNDE
jgi:hypothetical protein